MKILLDLMFFSLCLIIPTFRSVKRRSIKKNSDSKNREPGRMEWNWLEEKWIEPITRMYDFNFQFQNPVMFIYKHWRHNDHGLTMSNATYYYRLLILLLHMFIYTTFGLLILYEILWLLWLLLLINNCRSKRFQYYTYFSKMPENGFSTARTSKIVNWLRAVSDWARYTFGYCCDCTSTWSTCTLQNCVHKLLKIIILK